MDHENNVFLYTMLNCSFFETWINLGLSLIFCCLKLGQIIFFLRQGCTSKKNDIERLVCVTEKAGFMDLPQECITCLTMSKMTAKSAFSECLGGIQNQMNVPGLLVLSKRKLRNSKMVYFRSNVKELLPRGYLRVEV